MLVTTRSLGSKNQKKLGLSPVKKPYVSFSISCCEDAVLTLWSPQKWLEMSQPLVKNICILSLRASKLSWVLLKISSSLTRINVVTWSKTASAGSAPFSTVQELNHLNLNPSKCINDVHKKLPANIFIQESGLIVLKMECFSNRMVTEKKYVTVQTLAGCTVSSAFMLFFK